MDFIVVNKKNQELNSTKVRDCITPPEYLELAELDAEIEKRVKQLFFKRGVPAFAIIGVLEKQIYNINRTAEEKSK